jgi:hypothetical protein
MSYLSYLRKLRLPYFALVAAALSLLALTPLHAAAQGANPNQNPKKPFVQEVTGTLPNGSRFEGTISDLAFSYENVNGKDQLMLKGVLNGDVDTGRDKTKIKDQAFKVPATLSQTAPAAQEADSSAAHEIVLPAVALQQQATCDILFLTVGPINLDLLGLVVNLSPIVLNIDAVPGPGNLLGNLLCAIAGLLDPGSNLDLTGVLRNVLISLINALNQILAGL